ncbi:signal recognition particle 68 kda protein putative [Entamoeba histolytica]|uniref:Signal recognition particle subunit SRP68 n=1 Tax=Entamoeba histolytica TaxID=5759 RepID=A0A175K115_ENTHI|nr:signal recognition particle 68 kda protein putative [Entamoeba histolytica]
MSEIKYKKLTTKLDKGLNLCLFETIFNWRQVNGLKHDDYTRYRRFCSRRIKRIRQKVQLINKWEKKQFKQLKLVAEHMKTSECLMIPLLKVERCWAYANELQPVDETEARKGHHQKRRLHKMKQYCEEFIGLMKGCNKRTQREITAYNLYMKGMVAFEDHQYEDALKYYFKSITIIGYIDAVERMNIIQKAVSHCNKMISNKKIANRMMYKELLDYAREEKYKLSVAEIIENINELEKHLGQFSLGSEHIDSNGKLDIVMAEYSKLIYMEKKKPNPKTWQISSWQCYQNYYHCLSLFNQNKLKESYTQLRELIDTIDELTPSVEASERKRLETTLTCTHQLVVELLKSLWKEKTGDKALMIDACSQYLEYPSLEKKGWFSWW